jgi:hypothetical protein
MGSPLSDAIRIVPVYGAAALAEPAHGVAAAAAPRLVYEGGPLLGAVEVVTVFLGAWWEVGSGAELGAKLNDFFDFVLTSALIDQLAEYDVPGTAIGHGRRVGTQTVGTWTAAASVRDQTLRQTLQQAIADGTLPPASPARLYFLHLPPEVAVVQGGGRSCQAFCGYHDDIDGNVFYAVMPYPGCNGCGGGIALLDALTTTTSHELCEAITDPVPGTGWYDQVHGEIGDICAWQTKKVGVYAVQLEWSNREGTCV